MRASSVYVDDFQNILRQARLFQVRQQLQALFQSSASSEDPEEDGVDLDQQRMLIECLLEDRRSLQSDNAVRDHRLRFPFLFSRRRSSTAFFNYVEEDAQEEVLKAGQAEPNSMESTVGSGGSGLEEKERPQQELLSESSTLAATSNPTEPPPPTSSNANQSNSVGPSIAHHPNQMSSVFNMEPSSFDAAATKLSSYFPDPVNAGLSTVRRQSQLPANKRFQPPPNLLVWHRYTEVPFDISCSEFTVKTPVLPLMQGGHMVFLTSQCGQRTRHHTVKIIKRSTGQSGATRQRQRQNCQLAVINKDEFLVLKKLGHPCVATMLYFCENLSLYYYFFPHYLFANLSGNFSLFNRLDANACVYVTCCMINAVEYLYRNCIIHRDISTKSVLFTTEGRPVLFHFDYATFHGSLRSADAKVTFLPELSSRAPEVISADICKSCEPEFYPNCDIWGIGVLLGELLLSSKVMMRALKRKLDLHWVFSVRETGPDVVGVYAGVPKDLMELLRSCLRKHPQDRPSIHTMMLNSGFIQYGVSNIHTVLFQRSPIDRIIIRA